MQNTTVTVFNGTEPLNVSLPFDSIAKLDSAVWRQTLMIVPLPSMILYDYIITLPEEINTLWRRKKTITSLALLLNRYGLLLLALTFILQLFPVDGDPVANPRCKMNIYIGDIGMVSVLVAVIVFDTLRIYAIMQKCISAGLGVAVLGAAWFVAWWIIPHEKGLTTTFSNGALLGCQRRLVISVNGHIIQSRTYLRDGINLALETLVLGITIFKSLGLKRMAARIGIKRSLGGMLLQDGSLQFAIVLFFSILDISMFKTLGEPVPTIIIKSIITSHFAFHLRQVHFKSSGSTQTQSRSLVSTLRFNVVGNVGAPIHNVFSDDTYLEQDDNDEIQYSSDPMATMLDAPSISNLPEEV